MSRPVIALDFDGTLVDSMPSLRQLAVDVICEVVPDCPHPDLIQTRYDRTAGETFRTQLETILPRPDYHADIVEAAATVYEERKREVTMDAQPFREAWICMSRMTRHADLWVVTSTVTDLVVQCLAWQDLWQHFHGCLGPRYGTKWEKLRMLGATHFVGDTNRDREHASWAGAMFLGVQRDPNLLADGDEDLRPITEFVTRLAVDA